MSTPPISAPSAPATGATSIFRYVIASPRPTHSRPHGQLGAELERAMGIEPTALGLGSRCSTTELRPLQAAILRSTRPTCQPGASPRRLLSYSLHHVIEPTPDCHAQHLIQDCCCGCVARRADGAPGSERALLSADVAGGRYHHLRTGDGDFEHAAASGAAGPAHSVKCAMRASNSGPPRAHDSEPSAAHPHRPAPEHVDERQARKPGWRQGCASSPGERRSEKTSRDRRRAPQRSPSARPPARPPASPSPPAPACSRGSAPSFRA